MKRKIAILYVGEPRPPGGCEIYRGNMPVHFLGQYGNWETAWLYYAEVQRSVGQRGIAAMLSFFKQFSLLVFPRFYANSLHTLDQIADLFRVIHRLGVKIVYEVDDDFTNRYREVLPKDASAIEVAKLADAITVSTPHLGRLMEKETGKPCYVLPNMLDPNLWDVPLPLKKDGLIRIGLTGSQTHYGDWKVLETVMPRILARHDQVRLILGAFHPDYLSNLPHTDYLPALPYAEYAHTVKQFDIVLAPLDPQDGFNLSKSEIKTTEGMGACRTLNGTRGGAAVIATDHPVYRRGVTPRTGILVPHEPDAWFEAIDHLVTDSGARKRYQLEGYRWAWKNRNIARGWTLWDKAYRKIIAS